MELTTTAAAAILLVRVYGNHVVAAKDVHAAQGHAQAALQAAGVPLSWMDCAPKAPPASSACSRPVGPSEIVVRIVSGGAPGAERQMSLGFSYVDEDSSAPPRLATVFADRVSALSQRTHMDRGRLLGLAVAHEVGHLLLNSARHSTRGLMRAFWSQAELRRDAPADWLFDAGDATRMRASVAARVATAATADQGRQGG
jgi:hypothetical protein